MKTMYVSLMGMVCGLFFSATNGICQVPTARSVDKASGITPYTSKKESDEDDRYESKHKNTVWFRSMNKPGADYFAVKRNFDRYFSTHRWENSKTRETGEAWIKSKIFYLDKNGRVQAPPPFDIKRYGPPVVTSLAATASTRTVGTWTMIGPVNSATTAYSSSGNHGGYVFNAKFDPGNTQKIFISFLTGGMWVTADGGITWTLADANMPATRYYDFDVCRSAPAVVYSICDKGVLKSTDGGMSWAFTTLTSAAYSGRAYDIAVSPANPDIAIARWADKLYRTADGGTTWAIVKSGLPDYTLQADCSIQSEMADWSITDDNVVYVLSALNSTQVELYKSADQGATFSLLTTITRDPAANGAVIGWAKLLQASNNLNELYVAYGTGATNYAHMAVHLYKLNRTTGAEVLKRVNMIDGTTFNLHHGDIAMDRTDENKIIYATYGVPYFHYSGDNGISFSQSSTTHYDNRTADMVSNSIIMGSDGELAYSANQGTTITTLTNSISNHELWGFGAAFKSDLVAIGANHGPVMVKEAANGFEWYNGPGADQGNTDVNPLDDRYIYSQGYDNYRFFRTGVHTMVNQQNMLDVGGIYHYFNSVEFHPNLYYSLITHHAGQYPAGNPNLLTWSHSLIRTDDNGNSIRIIKTFSDVLFREKICMTNPDYIYAVVGLTNNHLWKTTDGGTTWTDITPSSVASNGQTNISDLAVSDTDPNELWITYSGVQTSCKVLKSSNGGSNWTNLTQPLLTSFPNTKIIFQRGSNGGVYVANNSGVYYRNNIMANWAKLGTGLPEMEIRFMFINYNLGKLRIGTSRGGWEHDLYEVSPPKAQISANTNKVTCTASEQVQFKDYSTVRNASATWSWSFPGGTPATSNVENPVVSYAGAANGFYDVSLTVTDAYGSSTQTLTNFIQVDGTDCAIDTIPGKLLTLATAGDYAQQSRGPGITTNTLTLSAWIKPDGIQSAFSGILFSPNGGASGFNFRDNNRLGYHWNNSASTYNWAGGPIVPANTWSHVALVINPGSVVIYLNGTAYTQNVAHPAVNLSSAFLFGSDRGNLSRNFKGQMDEICIYNRSLSADEIRQLMNLTRNNPNAGSMPSYDPSLIAYYQFNEGAGKPAYDKAGSNHVSLIGNATKTDASTAPVGGGTFSKITVNSGGLKDFVAPGVELVFPSAGTYPNGDIIVTRLHVRPDQVPATALLPGRPESYFIIRNYGTNTTFSPLTSMKFKNLYGISTAMQVTPSAIKLFKRQSADFGNTWGASVDDADAVENNAGTGAVEFSTGLNNTSFSQFVIGTSLTPLPVQLISFSATAMQDNKVDLLWNVATENDLGYYQAERSTDGHTFSPLGSINAQGHSTYTFTDLTPAEGFNYYRLKLVDRDGKFVYSYTKQVLIRHRSSLQLLTNPAASGTVGFRINGLRTTAGLMLTVTGTNGQLIRSQYFSRIENNTTYTFGLKAAGTYFVRAELTDGQIMIRKIVLQ